MISSRRRFLPLLLLACLVALAVAAAPAPARLAYTLDYEAGTATVIDTTTNQVVGAPIPVGDGPYTNAITPDGRYMYVGNYDGEDLVVVDLATNQAVGAPLPLDDKPTVLAISPDGGTVYVAEEESKQITVLSTATKAPSAAPIALSGIPWGIAFAPDGRTAFVAEAPDTISTIDTATHQVGAPIPVGEGPINIAFTPDGTLAFVTNEDSDSVSVIDVAARAPASQAIPVGSGPWGVAITPDGKFAFVVNYAGGSVSVIDIQTRAVVGPPIPVGDQPYEVAITPDGRTAYVPNYGSQTVSAISIATREVTTIPVSGGPWQIAITPNRGPVASFREVTATAGVAATFDASSTFDPDGTIVSFNWNFGDGATAALPVPVANHTFAKAGTYPVRFWATDNEGCGAAPVFTGRTASCTGTGALLRGATVVSNKVKFGKLTRNRRTGTAKLKVRVPGAGVLLLTGKGVKKVKRNVAKATTASLAIKPKAKLRKKLLAKGQAKVRLAVKFTPRGGQPATVRRTVKLIRK